MRNERTADSVDLAPASSFLFPLFLLGWIALVIATHGCGIRIVDDSCGALRRHVCEVDLEIRRKGAERLARAGPRHRGASRQRHDAVVIADEGPDAVCAAQARHAVRGRIPALLGYA